MEFYAQQSELLDELDLIQGAVERKSTILILSHFLVKTAGSRLQISASDHEVGARSSCRVELKTEGKVAVPARRLVDIIRSLPDGEIRFKRLENHWVHITCQRSSFKLASMATDNFPALPELPKSVFTLPGDVLAGLIDRDGVCDVSGREPVLPERAPAVAGNRTACPWPPAMAIGY
jgi:DNA polymerase III subunit beta